MPESQEQLTEHSEHVWRTVVRLLGDSEDARECFQQTFVDGLRLEPSTVRNWRAVLCRIATRRSMDLLRRRYREQGSVSRLEAEPLDEERPEAELDFHELRHAVRETLATLPPNQAEAFWLRHMEDLSPEEIGRQLGIEPGHVRVLVHRAVTRLRKSLHPEYGEHLTLRGEK